jgi:hypothetical protein
MTTKTNRTFSCSWCRNGDNMKHWIVKHITQREVRDLHSDIADKINKLDIETVLDIAPPHAIDISTIISANYISIGLTGKRLDIKHDLNEYPYPITSNEYDVVIMSHILEHLENPFMAMAEAYRIAKKYLIIAAPTSCEPTGNNMEHIWKYDTTFTLGRRCGRYMPKPIRKMLSKNFARSMAFIIRKRQHTIHDMHNEYYKKQTTKKWMDEAIDDLAGCFGLPCDKES